MSEPQRDSPADGNVKVPRIDKRGSEQVQMSKKLSYLLRHGADKAGLVLRTDGYAKVADVLRKGRFPSSTSLDQIRAIVDTCEKQRFTLTEIDGELYIRANQGHTIKQVDRDKMYKKIDNATEYPVCIHGTRHKAWDEIKTMGLCKGSRNEIHCAKGEFGETLSGYRATSQVLIYINLPLCLEQDIPWFESENGVLLTPGLGSRGILPTGYFSKVIDVKTKQELPDRKSVV